MDSSEGGELSIAEDGGPHTEEYHSAVTAMKEHVHYDDMQDICMLSKAVTNQK